MMIANAFPYIGRDGDKNEKDVDCDSPCKCCDNTKSLAYAMSAMALMTVVVTDIAIVIPE